MASDPDNDGDNDTNNPNQTGPASALINMKNPGPGDIRKMVAAHAKVPDKMKAGYRKKVIGMARKGGHMAHVPDAWVKGK